jgi:hypothetical protein
MERRPVGAAIGPLEGQTMEDLMDALQGFLQEKLKEYRLPVKNSKRGDVPPYRPIRVGQMVMDDPDEDDESVPHLLLQPLNGKDQRGEDGQLGGKVSIRIVITIFNRNKLEGRLQLMHIIQTIRRELESVMVVGKSFELLWPFEWLIYPDDMECYHMGEISTVWSVPTIERQVPQVGSNWMDGLNWG